MALQRAWQILGEAGSTFLDLVYPPLCPLCQARTEAGFPICPACIKAAPRLEAPFCQRCNQPFDGVATKAFRCTNCSGRKFAFDICVTNYRARDVVREAVHRFKYNDDRAMRHALARWLDDSLDDPRVASRKFDLIVPVPLHHLRERERGFNQAAVLAEMVGERRKVPVCQALRRKRHTETQTRHDREERMENLRNAFQMRKNVTVTKLHLLLVDDVFTTGSTVQECARVLRKAGAASICVATVARG